MNVKDDDDHVDVEHVFDGRVWYRLNTDADENREAQNLFIREKFMNCVVAQHPT